MHAVGTKPTTFAEYEQLLRHPSYFLIILPTYKNVPAKITDFLKRISDKHKLTITFDHLSEIDNVSPKTNIHLD